MPGQIAKPGNVGGKLASALSERQRQIFTLQETFDCHVEAETEENAQNLFANVLAAIWTELGPDFQPGGYRWVTEDEGTADYAIRNPQIVFRGHFMLPVTSEIKALTTLINDPLHTSKFGSTEEEGCA